MLRYSDLDARKKAFVFELDNVLYPEKDYLLQVYYLFANFLEYTETYPPAAELTGFMKKAYEHAGPEGLFEKAREAFGIDVKYLVNFERLHRKARLPLRLILFDEAFQLLRDIVAAGKEIIIITGGDPEMQLNKIGQTDWLDLASQVRIYFADEIKPKPAPDVLNEVLGKHGLKRDELLVIGKGELDRQFAASAAIDFIEV